MPGAASSGAAAVAAAAGGLATWLPDGRWTTPADLDAPPAEPPARRRFRLGAGAGRAGSDRGRIGARAGVVRRGGASSGAPQRDGAVAARRRVAVARVGARLAGWPRRVVAAGLALAAVVLLVRQDPVTPAAVTGMTTPVVVVAGDLAAGTTLARAHVRTAALPEGVVPAGAARDVRAVVGRVLAGSVRRGEPLTDARLLGPGLTAGLDPTESTAVPVRLADPETVSLVRAGDRVDVLGTPVQADGGAAPDAEAVPLATSVRVLAVLPARDAADGALLVVAADPRAGRRLTGAAAGHRLTVAVRPP